MKSRAVLVIIIIRTVCCFLLRRNIIAVNVISTVFGVVIKIGLPSLRRRFLNGSLHLLGGTFGVAYRLFLNLGLPLLFSHKLNGVVRNFKAVARISEGERIAAGNHCLFFDFFAVDKNSRF